MAEQPDETDALPPHIEETVQSAAQLHLDHHRNVTPIEHRSGAIAGFLVRPASIAVFSVVVGGWIAFNIAEKAFGYPPIDPAPFAGLAMAVSLASFCLMVLVLANQRQEDRLAQLREQLTLELALLSERKAAKIIELFEEFRRDIPLVQNRVDRQAEAMAKPADPEQVVGAIKETHAAAEEPANSLPK